jgi:ribonuclease P protein component
VENNPKTLLVLKNSSDFRTVYESGKSFSSAPWVLINFSWNNLGCLRCGWTVSRRIGNAVIRNRLKRWCREFFREKLKVEGTALDGSGVDINVVFRHKVGKEFFRELKHEEFNTILQKSWENIFRNH